MCLDIRPFLPGDAMVDNRTIVQRKIVLGMLPPRDAATRVSCLGNFGWESRFSLTWSSTII